MHSCQAFTEQSGHLASAAFHSFLTTMMDDLASELSGSRWRKRRRNANSISFKTWFFAGAQDSGQWRMCCNKQLRFSTGGHPTPDESVLPAARVSLIYVRNVAISLFHE